MSSGAVETVKEKLPVHGNSLYEKSIIAIAILELFNAVETKKNQFMCDIIWLIWYK
jgi:hypothetical protein